MVKKGQTGVAARMKEEYNADKVKDSQSQTNSELSKPKCTTSNIYH